MNGRSQAGDLINGGVNRWREPERQRRKNNRYSLGGRYTCHGKGKIGVLRGYKRGELNKRGDSNNPRGK